MVVSNPMSPFAARPQRRYLRAPARLHFPVSEEVPESTRHMKQRNQLFETLEREFGARALIASDQVLYWDATNPKRCMAPDVAVRMGLPTRLCARTCSTCTGCVRTDRELGPTLRLCRDAAGTDLVFTPLEIAQASLEAAHARIAELEAKLAK